MSLVKYVDRKNTDCAKWDAGLFNTFGDDELLAMWVADMDFQSPQEVIDAVTDYASKGVYAYYSVPDSYYQSFINWESKYHGLDVEKDWIRFSPGVVSGFSWGVNIMTEPGDSVIVLEPVYYPFFNAINNNGRNLVKSELIRFNGEYTIDYADFEVKIVENNVSLFILCSPHNPVGRVWKPEELRKLFEICRRHNVFVLSDEIHHDLTYLDHYHTPSLSVGNYNDMMIMFTAPSKTFNLAGGQNSIVVIPDENVRERWDTYVNQIQVTNGNPFGYIAATAAYTHGEEWLSEVKDIIFGNYLYVKETLDEYLPGIDVYPLEGTYLLWIDFGSYVDAEYLSDFLQNRCRLALDYGEWFGGEKFGTFARMNLATSRENVEIAVNAIIDALK